MTLTNNQLKSLQDGFNQALSEYYRTCEVSYKLCLNEIYLAICFVALLLLLFVVLYKLFGVLFIPC